jgi:drug/metabolite transporter (DMT)-like permease
MPPRQPEVTSIAFAVLALFAAMLIILTFHEAPTANQQLLNTMLGLLGAAFTGLVGYYFGSSNSSRGKDHTIASLSTPITTDAVNVPVTASTTK